MTKSAIAIAVELLGNGNVELAKKTLLSAEDHRCKAHPYSRAGIGLREDGGMYTFCLQCDPCIIVT